MVQVAHPRCSAKGADNQTETLLILPDGVPFLIHTKDP
jgi:hypothetical protein